jgi:hypothetical protein
MLENAVHDVAELRQVRQTANLYCIHTGEKLDFDKYYTLLNNSAVDYDHGFKPRKDKHQVLVHEIQDADMGDYGSQPGEEDGSPSDTICDTSSLPSMLVYASEQSSRPTPRPKVGVLHPTTGPKMPFDHWAKLDIRQ